MAQRPTVLRSSGASLITLRLVGGAPLTLRASDNQGTAAKTRDVIRESLAISEARSDALSRQTSATFDVLDEAVILYTYRERDSQATITVVTEPQVMSEVVILGATSDYEPRFEAFRVSEASALSAAYSSSILESVAAREAVADANPLLLVAESLPWHEAVANFFATTSTNLEFPVLTESGASVIAERIYAVEPLGLSESVTTTASEKFVETRVEVIPFFDGTVMTFAYAPSVGTEAYSLNEFARDGDGQVLIEFESDSFMNSMSGFTDTVWENFGLTEAWTSTAVVGGTNTRTEAYTLGEVRTDSYVAAIRVTENVNENIALVWSEVTASRMSATNDFLTEVLRLSGPGNFDAPVEYQMLVEVLADFESVVTSGTTDTRSETYSVEEVVVTSGSAGINDITELIPLSSGG